MTKNSAGSSSSSSSVNVNPGGSQASGGLEVANNGDGSQALPPEMPQPQREVIVTMPKLSCTVDLHAVDLPKQLDDFNDSFRDALIMCKLIDDDGRYLITNRRVMAIWRTNVTQEIKDAIKELSFDNEADREDYLIVSAKLVKMRQVRGLARMHDFNLSLVIREQSESFDQFKKRLLAQASLCEWSTEAEKNRALINQLVRGVNNDAIRMKLLQSDLQQFDQLIALAVQLDTSEKGSQKIAEVMARGSASAGASAGVNMVEDVHALRSRGSRGSRFGHSHRRGGRGGQFSGSDEMIVCKHCGSHHIKSRQVCGARDHVCSICNGTGHFEAFCYRNTAGGSRGSHQHHQKRRGGHSSQGGYGSPPKRGRGQEYGYAMHHAGADEQYEDGEEILRGNSQPTPPNPQSPSVSGAFDLISEIKHVKRDETKREWFERINFCTGNLRMKIDSGATIDVMPMSSFRKLNLSLSLVTRTRTQLVTYSNNVIQPIGEFRVRVAFGGRSTDAHFMLIDGEGQPLLGFATAAALNLFQNSPPEVVHALLSMHEEPVRIKLRPGAVPVQIPPRRVPIALREKVKKELDRMVKIGVIRPVNEPTEWVHPMIVTDKPRNPDAVRVCIDPRHLNPFIERATFQIPNFETIMAEISSATVMSTIDLESGFWQAPVTEDSIPLLTFGTPWGRYQYLRLPFGLSNAPEEFHRRLVDALKDIPGVIVYLDDIFVHGENDEQHDERVARVLCRLKQVGFTPNKNKCTIRSKSVRFLGHIFENGKILPDPDKVKAILEFPKPTNISQLRSFKGLVGFCAKFYPDLHHVLHPFRALSKASETFAWTNEHDAAFEEVKQLVAKKVSLTLFDPSKPVEIWCDASPHGLGAILLQDQGPVCCASRTLVGPEKNYPQIDIELLAVIWALERFDLFTYGRHVLVRSDHSPLTRIVKKPLADLSIRQQRLVARSLRYDFDTTGKTHDCS